MSYTSMGSYYEFENHQVFNGMGAFGGIRETFNAAAVNADAQKGARIVEIQAGIAKTCPNPLLITACNGWKALAGPANAAGGRATRAIQQALGELGHDPGPVDGMWGPNTTAAWNDWKKGHGLAASPGPDVTLNKMQAMENDLRGGVGKAGLGALGAVALVALAVFGGVALLKKKKGTRRAASPMRLSA